jgi:predicted MFS family arabinose efflux permease
LTAAAVRELTRPRTARAAVSCLFLILGLGFGTWAVRIPDFQESYGLSNGALGTALLAIAIGSLIGMPLAGALTVRLDSATLARACAIAFIASLAVIPFAAGFTGLFAVLLCLGAANGAFGVAMNSQAALLEARLGSPVMSTCHGVFSVGTLGGALSSGAIAQMGVSPGAHLTGVAALLLALAAVAAPHLVRDQPAEGKSMFARPDRDLLAFGALAFCVLFAEGSVTDWSAVFLRDELEAGPALAAAGYAGFGCAMAAGRLLGDRIRRRWGAIRLITGAGCLALVGVVVTLTADTVLVAVAGFILLGAGLSIVFPTTLAIAAAYAGARSDTTIAAISTMAYFGFLLGPPAIGYLADATGLRGGLAPVALCAAAIIVLSRVLPRAAVRP